MPIGEAFLSASVELLFKKLASPLITELGKLYGVKDELTKLQKTLKRLGAMLRDAEQKKMEGEAFTLWLQELKNAACDAEDVLEEFGYEDLRRKVESTHDEGSKHSTWRKLRRMLRSIFILAGKKKYVELATLHECLCLTK